MTDLLPLVGTLLTQASNRGGRSPAGLSEYLRFPEIISCAQETLYVSYRRQLTAPGNMTFKIH